MVKDQIKRVLNDKPDTIDTLKVNIIVLKLGIMSFISNSGSFSLNLGI